MIKEPEDRGYVIVAMQDFEYEQATALAYSIKLQNKKASVSLVTNYTDRIPEHFHEVFDYLIELPYGFSETTRANEWQLYWCTPYVHTMVVDCASLVKENHDSTWDYLIDQKDICFFNRATNFKGAPLVNKNANVLEINYKLTKVYSSMYYFKHDTDIALAYFKLADVFMQNWREVYAHYFSEVHKPSQFSPDIIHSLLNTVIIHDDPLLHKDLVTIVNMPVTLEDGNIGVWDKWTDCLNTWASKGAKIKIQNFAISTNLYYGEQEFLTQEIFDEHRNTYLATSKK
jgi:hypothetical protein